MSRRATQVPFRLLDSVRVIPDLSSGSPDREPRHEGCMAAAFTKSLVVRAGTAWAARDGSPAGQFLGIIIGNPGSAGALAAHIAHGDGSILATFNPPLHLASQDQNHRAANVECLGQRIVPQPPEAGN